ncbi:endopeptidase La [bacterium 1XD21-13]|nr:endopeptidase La [bacterium 1XD21-13]
MNETIQILAVVALRGMTILPDMAIHFDVSREGAIHAIEQAMLQDKKLFLVTQKDKKIENPGQGELYRIGTIASVKQVMKMPGNVVRVLAEGLGRGELLQFRQEEDHQEAEVRPIQEELTLPADICEAMIRSLKEGVHAYGHEVGKQSRDLERQVDEMTELPQLMNQIMIKLPFRYEEKQRFLEALGLSDRFELVYSLINKETEIMRFKRELQEKIKTRVDKNQREYLLREQMKVIREELGEDTSGSDADHFREALGKLRAPKEVKEKLEKEIHRFQNTGNNSSENAVIRGYIETLLELPWEKGSRDSTDLKRAEEILNADHYGMEKVKERVLEFLAVRILTKKGSSPILCLVGPPGTGKTSIARSVAKALGKKYVRICLGGVRDEAEIRGHRRTYVGAMPGRIVAGMRQAGVKNPLMLLDEIDKVSSDYKGDTSSALLEVLDSEQNNRFQDHYVELPIDLSEVLFIATANDVQTIPRPLLDRMEIIEVSSYTENEKVHIAREHLIGKQMEKNGLKEGQLFISSGALETLIHSYTREAGVRQLERKLGEVCRKAAREILEQNKKAVRLTESNLSRYLGKPRYTFDMANETDEVGIVRGLAWTSVGGDTLQIEVNIMPGKGEISLTGMMGEVMKESARTGLSYIRSVSAEYHIAKEFFQEHDIHIHIPEGAVPKDGPSAGITMATAMLSAITGIPVYASVAMTGEITLRGRVLPIGGLKEKILAAKSAGIKTVLVPARNKRDVEEISSEIRKGIQIVYVEQMKEVLEAAFHDH